jgi:hypothetical protein
MKASSFVTGATEREREKKQAGRLRSHNKDAD